MTRRKPKSRAGRPALGAKKRSVVVSVKLTPAEHAAVAAKVVAENELMIADGSEEAPATVASYMRDCALDTIGLATFETRPGD